MSALNRWSREKMVDAQGRPYFLWDVDMTLVRFEELLRDPNAGTRAAAIGKLMRQARPDDVFTFVSAAEIRAEWPRIEVHLGKTREFWVWLLAKWREQGVA
ncbi:MAG: hypothetical protein ABL998_13590 [Planctomycetota bacterium]